MDKRDERDTKAFNTRQVIANLFMLLQPLNVFVTKNGFIKQPYSATDSCSHFVLIEYVVYADYKA
jgi:hypothetical protein